MMLYIGFTIPINAENDFSIILDKSIYFLRDTVIINGDIDRNIPDDDRVKFEIINPRGIVVDRFEIEIDDKLVFTHSLSLISSVWNDEGLYRIRATYADSMDTAYFHVFQSNTGLKRHVDSTIGFDKEKYGWTDEVEIFVIAPAFNRNNGAIEKIGMGGELGGTITIKTSKAKLDKFMLTESDIDSGVFSGKLILTGDSLRDANGDGIKLNDATGETGIIGSTEGRISAFGSDKLTVIFENEQEKVESSSNITLKLGQFQKMPKQIDIQENIEVFLDDSDLNFENSVRNTAYILVWSESDNQSQKIKLLETTKKSGIFKGFVHLSTEKPGLDRIKVKESDVIHIKYFDNTVPIEISKTGTQEVITEIHIGAMPISQNTKMESKIEIPPWIRNNAKWYAEGKINESEFTQGIAHMINNNIMHIPNLPEKSNESVTSKVPDWIKNNAKWWSESKISDGDFVKGIEYLVKTGIIKVN